MWSLCTISPRFEIENHAILQDVPTLSATPSYETDFEKRILFCKIFQERILLEFLRYEWLESVPEQPGSTTVVPLPSYAIK